MNFYSSSVDNANPWLSCSHDSLSTFFAVEEILDTFLFKLVNFYSSSEDNANPWLSVYVGYV